MSFVHFTLYTFLILTIIGLSIALAVIVEEKKKMTCPEVVCETKPEIMNKIAAKVRNYNFIVYLKSENNNTFFSTMIGCDCPSDNFAILQFDRNNTNLPTVKDSEGKTLVFEYSDNEKKFYFTDKPLNETRKTAEVRFISDIGLTVTSSIGSTVYYLSYEEPLRNALKCPLILPTKATTYKTILSIA